MFHVLGSTTVGQHIAAIAAPSMKKLSLELGGKNAAVVFHDANLEEAVDGLTRLDTLYEHPFSMPRLYYQIFKFISLILRSNILSIEQWVSITR